jgi:putative ABC transport system permease protein
MPGVSAAGLSLSLPPNNLEISDSFTIEIAPWPPDTSQPIVPVVFINPGYFASLGVAITAGRGFTEADRSNSPGVVIISQLLADRYFGDENPIGKRFRVGGPERPKNAWMEIVGVAGDLKYSGLSAKPEPAYYLPLAQNAWLSSYLVVRTMGSPMRLLPELREQIWTVDRDIPIAQVATMDQLMSESVAEPRFRSLLLGIFAGVALLLASVGVYGVISYSVMQRNHEIGIRLALGARASSVVALVLKQGAVLAGAGLAIGLVGAFALTRLMEEMLFEVSTTDQAIFVGVTALLGFVAVAACYIPARRASRVDPMDALRWE